LIGTDFDELGLEPPQPADLPLQIDDVFDHQPVLDIVRLDAFGDFQCESLVCLTVFAGQYGRRPPTAAESQEGTPSRTAMMKPQNAHPSKRAGLTVVP
jgi:hypothetical protein